MSAPAPSISVRAGAAEPPSMALAPGQAVGPLAIGRSGTWRVVAPGVLEEHAFLYFDGNALFLQSANPNAPVTVNGAPIPGDWTPVYAPCEIAFGGARLWFGPPAQSVAPAAPATPARQPFVPRVSGLDMNDEATRVQPIDEAALSRRSPAGPKPAAGGIAVATLKSSTGAPSFGAADRAFGAGAAPVPMGPGPLPGPGAPPASAFAPPTPLIDGSSAPMGPGPLFGPPPPAPMSAPPAAFPDPYAPPGAPASAPEKKGSWIGARWREASLPKKLLTVLMVPLVWAVWVIFNDKPPPPAPPKPATSASAKASASASASASAPPEVPPAEPVVAGPPTPTPSGKASAAPASSAKTPQREAADAVAAGAYDKAAKLYEELAKAHPEVPAYGEAARIMRAKSGKR